MRILIVVHGLPPLAIGGTELYADACARELAAQHGDRVLVIAREQDASRPEYEVRRERRDGYDAVFVNNTFRLVRSFEDSYANAAIAVAVAREIDDFVPDVAHIHHLTCLSTAIVPALRQRQIPVWLTLHDYWMMCHRGQRFDRRLQRCSGPDDGCRACVGPEGALSPRTRSAAAFLRPLESWAPVGLVHRATAALGGAATARRAADAMTARTAHMRAVLGQVTGCFAPSRSIRDHFVAFGVAPDRMVVSEYGVRAPSAGLNRRERGSALRLGYMGSLMVSKAPHLLLQAHARLPAGRATVNVFGGAAAYHGDASYAHDLQRLLRRPGVTAHGPWPHERLAEALAQLDVLVVPSVWEENSPFVIREAFAAGVPVVASRIGGIPETVQDEVGGLLFEPGDVDDLRRALLRLLEEPGLLDRLRHGVPRVRTLADDVAFTRTQYTVARPEGTP